MNVTRYKRTPAVVEAGNRYLRDWQYTHALRRVSVIMLVASLVLGTVGLVAHNWWEACLAVLPFAGSLIAANAPWPILDEYLLGVELVPEDDDETTKESER